MHIFKTRPLSSKPNTQQPGSHLSPLEVPTGLAGISNADSMPLPGYPGHCLRLVPRTIHKPQYNNTIRPVPLTIYKPQDNNYILCDGMECIIIHIHILYDRLCDWSLSLSGIVLRHTGVDSEHVTGGFRARKNCERVSNICVLKSVILLISVGNYRNK